MHDMYEFELDYALIVWPAAREISLAINPIVARAAEVKIGGNDLLDRCAVAAGVCVEDRPDDFDRVGFAVASAATSKS